MPRGWVWQIPITETITSIGVVTDGAGFVKAGESVDDFFARHVALNPVLAERMSGARRIHDFCREGNYSYVMDKIAGDGWLLVGDAARRAAGLSVPADELGEVIRAAWKGVDDGSTTSLQAFVKRVLADTSIWGVDLSVLPQLQHTVVTHVSRICSQGALRALDALLSAGVA